MLSISKASGKSGGAPGSDDEFNVAKLQVNETLNYIKKKQEERDHKVTKFGSSPDTLRMGAEIRDKIAELEKQIEKMNQALRTQRKNPKACLAYFWFNFPRNTLSLNSKPKKNNIITS